MLWNPPRELSEFYMRNRLLGSSERYRQSALAWRYCLNQQYSEKKPWTEDAPLHERRPKIVVPLFARAVRRMDAFIWGGSSFPAASIGATRKEGVGNARDIGPIVDPKVATQLSTFLTALIQAAELPDCARDFSQTALVSRSAGILLYTQGGYLRAFVQDGKDCTPTWSKEKPGSLQKLEILYRYKKEEPTAFSTVLPIGKQPEFWYRRVVDEARDVTYKEVPVREGGLQPEWIEDPEKTVEHNLGFCPAHWVRTFPDSADSIDGRPFIDPSLYPLIDDVNYTLSQKSRAVSYGTDPQPVRTGVPPEARDQLNKAPGKWWDLPEGGEIKFAEIQGSGADAAGKHLDELRRLFYESVDVVMMDPEALRGDISGRVLQLLYAPMMSLAGVLRNDFGQRGYCQLLNLALRLVAIEVGERGKDIWIPGVYEAAPRILAAQQKGAWLDFPVTLDWPPFLPEAEETPQEAFALAKGGVSEGLITRKTALQKIARVFGVKDVEAELAAAQQELADAQARSAALGAAVNPTAPVPVVPAKDAQAAVDEAKAQEQAEKQPPGGAG